MRIVEWASWWMALVSDNGLLRMMGALKFSELLKKGEYEDDIKEKLEKDAAEKFETAKISGRVFKCNDTFIELRAGAMENRRGFITLFTAMFLTLPAITLSALLYPNSFYDWQGKIDPGAIFAYAFFFLAFFAFMFVYFKWGLTITRFETFTTRWNLIRFNRVTRQVYLHRPKNMGGVVVIPWEELRHDFGAPLFPVTVNWQKIDFTGDGFPTTMAAFGNSGMSEDDQRAQWEWIRRYMDEGGLKNLERPKTMTKIPTPWYCVAAEFEGMKKNLTSENIFVLFLNWCILSPLYLLLSCGHFVSLCLCWTPRFPKIIREAGMPGKPVPHVSEITDYPPKIYQKLKENAYRWKVKPGHSPIEEKPEKTEEDFLKSLK